MTYLSLLVFLALEYIRPTSYVPALLVLHPNSLALFGTVMLSIVTKSAFPKAEIFARTNTRLLLVFLGLIGLSVLTADVTQYSSDVFRGVFEYLLLYWCISVAATDLRRFKGIFAVLTVSHIAVAMLTPGLLSTDERQNLAVGAFLGDANDFALSVNIAIPMCLFLVFDADKRLNRVLAAVALLSLAFIVVITQSRGGTLALMAVGGYYWIKSDKKVMTAFVAVAAIGLILALAPPTYWQRMNDIVNAEEGSAGGRILAWQAGMEMAADHPLLGVGAGHFAVKYGTQYRKSLEVPGATAHSIYFLVLGELGFPGIILVITVFVGNFMANRRVSNIVRDRAGPTAAVDRRLLASLSASLIAFVVGGAFLSALYYPHLYVLSALLASARHFVLQRSEQAAPVATVQPQGITYHPALRPRPLPARS
jgi:putative inorganic carbon (hco3(-)) transporter